MIRTVIIATLVASSLLSQDLYRTSGSLNGRKWETMDGLQQSIYVSGIFDGITIAALKSKEPLNLAEAFTVGDYRKELTHFYSSRENINIPISYAFNYCTLKFLGKMSEEAQQDELKALRLAFNEMFLESQRPK